MLHFSFEQPGSIIHVEMKQKLYSIHTALAKIACKNNHRLHYNFMHYRQSRSLLSLEALKTYSVMWMSASSNTCTDILIQDDYYSLQTSICKFS